MPDQDSSAPAASPWPPEPHDEGRRLQLANGNGHRPPPPDDGDEGPSDAEWPYNGNGDGRPSLPRELDHMGQLMGLCLHASARAWKRVIHGRQTPGDVRAVAITLFLECSRRGVTAEEVLQDLAA
jgi:hypothetical protein